MERKCSTFLRASFQTHPLTHKVKGLSIRDSADRLTPAAAKGSSSRTSLDQTISSTTKNKGVLLNVLLERPRRTASPPARVAARPPGQVGPMVSILYEHRLLQMIILNT